MRCEIIVPTSPPVPKEHFCVGSPECYFRYPRCNSPTNQPQRSSALWFLYREHCLVPPSSLLPQMLQLSAEILETSGLLAAQLNSHCMSETLLSNRVKKLPFIEVSLTKQETPSFLKSTPFLSWGTQGGFSGQIRLWTRENMCRRGWGEDQGVYHIQAGLSGQYTSCRSWNNGVTCPNKRNEWTY